MPLQSYLMEGEKVLSQSGVFYATDRRLIRYRKRQFSEEMDDIPYSRLTSVGVSRKPRKGLIWVGVTALGFVLSSLVTFIMIADAMKSLAPLLGPLLADVPGGANGFDIGPLVPPHLIGIAGSLAIIAFAIFVPYDYIQFRAPGLDKDAEARFRLRGAARGTNMELLRIVRQHSLAVSPDVAGVPVSNEVNQPK